MSYKIAFLLLLLFTGILPAQAQKRPAMTVRLRHQTVHPLPNGQQWLDSMASNGGQKDPVQVIMVFTELPGTKEKLLLEAAGIQLKDYLSDYSFTAIAAPLKRSVTAADLRLYGVMPVQPSWKVTVFPEPVSGSKNVELIVSCYPEISLAALQSRVKQAGGKMIYSPLADNHFYEIELPADQITTLAAWYGIRTIGPAARDQPLNFESTGATKASLAQLSVAFGGFGLMGDSITIGVGDNAAGMNHVDLRDRIINYCPTPYANHGMHITGITAGAGTMNLKGRGFAPHATVLNHLYNLVWARTGTMVSAHNMTVTNNSYASVQGNCSFEGVYDAYSQALDTVCLQYPNVLQVFAAGNDGSINCPPYLPGFGTVTGSYQPAKNVLVVAQTDKRYNWGINSSRGPVRDGRLKPEITAVGSEVLSTRGNDLYLVSGGTSMASPQVAGAAALVQQRYKQLNGNVTPPSDLIKLLLMNGAMDIGNPGPDYTFGFGMMNLKRSLDMLNNNRYARNSMTNGGQQDLAITVPANTAQLKVMIYWHEIAASVLATKQLVNNLDLEVRDPANNTTLPLVLNPDPVHVNDVAVNGVDQLNNVEQVVINTPASGTYTIRVKGTGVATANQSYVVAYDFIPVGVALTYPTAGATVQSGDSLRVYWDAAADTRSFTLELSANNGASWTVLDNAIPAGQRYYVAYPQGINAQQCQMRLTRNGTSETSVTGNFVINEQPVIRLSPVQCPGYMNISWNAVPNATGYQVLRKKGPYLQLETVVTDTVFSLKGLTLDSTYYMAVQPLINGVAGYRSLGISRKPNDGTCTGSFSNGDLMIEKLESPVSGRQLTSTQLGSSNAITVRLRNLDDVAATNYRVSYSFNGGAWQSQAFTNNIPPAGALSITIPAALNLSAAGNYSFRLAVTNLALADPVAVNDSLNQTIRHLSNAPVDLAAGFTEDFETSAAMQIMKDTLGFTPNEHWDFAHTNDTGRLRTFVNSDITISGNRSVSMDVLQYVAKPAANYLTGTFNTAAYLTTGTEVRLDFDYKIHGESHFPDSNKVWVRGNDTQPWRPLFSYNLADQIGVVQQARGVSVTDALAGGGQNFSSSMQVRFGQQDTTVIALNNYGTGLTLDNVRLFTVQNDMALDSVLSPKGALCNIASAPLRISIRNGVAQTLNNIQVSYRLDNLPVVTEAIASLAGKTSLTHTFSQPLNISANGLHTVQTWVSVAGDTYHANDTVTESIRNQPLIANYPYLENFEQGDGFWYAGGRNSSWGFGTPATNNVRNAASGVNTWKTNLAGGYNDNEHSYLYSPCFNIATLTQPMLSFSVVTDIENCGNTICDAAWVEYTTDNGINWIKLGAKGEGYAWYTDSAANVWNVQGDYRWHVASIPLPVSAQPVRLRFVMASDPGATGEGLVIDDVHIFNRNYQIYNGSSAGPLSQGVAGNQFTDFLSAGKIVAQIQPAGQNLGNTDVHIYNHATPDTASRQYYLQRSFMVNTAQQPLDSIVARFYVTDEEVISLVNATGCGNCSKPKDVYRLGISKYDDPVLANENGTLTDNVNGTWVFYPKSRIQWVPYDNGYYAEVKFPSFSEVWFNDGGPGGNLSLPVYTMGSNNLTAVFPNPNADGTLNLLWTTAMQRSIDVRLVDMMGKVVYQATLPSLNGKNSSSLNVGRMATGIYFLKCRIGNANFTQKVLFH